MKDRTILRQRSWVQRNPLLFSGVFTTTCLLIFFSRPIYDMFIRDSEVMPLKHTVKK